jgi:Fur family ferric uptake transcriptional regulator/Fur family peroxide stress response transcriptional regulator
VTTIETSLAAALRDRGQRVTPQRLMVARVMSDLDRHVTADAVFDEVSRRMPGVSLPTVYATLDLLAGVGLVDRVTTERGAVIYDPRTDEHHHLVCRRCGAVSDVEGPVESGALLDAARSAGFAPDHAQVVVRGVCAACAA